MGEHMWGGRMAFGVGAVAMAVAMAGCSDDGPSTQASVCEAYDSLSRSLLEGNGFFDNAIFDRAGDLASEASRFQGDTGVNADGSALAAIADSDSTSGGELDAASRNIAAMCGRPPLTVNAVVGG